MFGSVPARSTILLLAVGVALLGVAGVAAGDTFVSVSSEVVPEQPTTDEEFAMDVTFTNSESGSGTDQIRRVRVYDEPVNDSEEPEQLGEVTNVGAFSPGETRTVTVDEIEIDETGLHDLRVEALVGASGTTHTVEHTETVRVYRPEPLVDVQTETAVEGAWRTVNLTVANGQNASVDGVTVAVDSEDVSFRQSERSASTVAAASERTFQFEARPESAGVHDLDLTVTYEDTDGQYRETELTKAADFSGPDTPPEIRLTGISAQQTGDAVEVSGSASNTGTTAVDSVVVSVVETEGVQPVSPQPEFFVGSIEGSDFASFSVTADRADENATVPLEVSYVVDGVQQTTTTEVEPETGGSGQPAQVPANAQSGGGGLPIGLIAVGLLAVVAVGIGYRRLA